MYIDDIVVPGPHGLKMVLLQPKQQRLGNFDKSILVDEYLLGS